MRQEPHFWRDRMGAFPLVDVEHREPELGPGWGSQGSAYEEGNLVMFSKRQALVLP